MVAITDTSLQFASNDHMMVVVVTQAIQTPRLKTLLKRFKNTRQSIAFISSLKRQKRVVLKSSTITSLKFYHTHKPDFSCDIEESSLDASSLDYSIPESINEMGQLKVLTVKGHCDYPSKLHNLSLLASLPNLTTLRFEHVSVTSIQPILALRNLKKLSFVMCEVGDALMNFNTESPYNMLPNLTHLEIDMCYDLKQLPLGVCNLVNLQKLSVTNCHELGYLPKELGGLSNLESLSLHSCTKLQELPESIGSLRNLSSIDISDCLSISVLPEEIGELCGLRVLKMNGCTGLQELPMSTTELSLLEEVICDEETSYMWMDIESDLPNLMINVVEDDRLETFMKIVQ